MAMPGKVFLCLLLLMVISSVNLSASNLSFESSPGKKTNLIEIFTSEGCSSCPPAHQWINGFKKDPRLWKDFIPAVFHVDYWDQLGWKDKFDSPNYTDRQRKYSLWWVEPTLFTPCVVLNGKILERWDSVKNFPVQSQNAGALKLDVLGGDEYQISFLPDKNSGEKLKFHIILLGLGIESQIKRGENSGKILKHEFTVLDYQHADVTGENLTAQFKLKISDSLPEEVQPKKCAVAGWVSEGSDPSPIQAVGGELE